MVSYTYETKLLLRTKNMAWTMMKRRETYNVVIDYEDMSPPRQVVYAATILSEYISEEGVVGWEHEVEGVTPLSVDLWFTDSCLIVETGDRAKKFAPPISDKDVLEHALLI